MKFHKKSCRACGGSSTNYSSGKQKKNFTLTSAVKSVGLNTLNFKKNTMSNGLNINTNLHTNLYNFNTISNRRYQMILR